MSELEDRISSVLNDPEQLARISAMAQKLMGGETAGEPREAAPPLSGSGGPPPFDLGALLKGGLGGKSRQLRALEALAPCLDETRRQKLQRAIGAARVFGVLRSTLGTEGGDV